MSQPLHMPDSSAKSLGQTWTQAARQALRGKDPLQELSWKYEDYIALKPYYDASDLPIHLQKPPRPAPQAADPPTDPHTWHNFLYLTLNMPLRSLESALHKYAKYAQGVVLDAGKITRADLKTIAKKIPSSFSPTIYRFSACHENPRQALHTALEALPPKTQEVFCWSTHAPLHALETSKTPFPSTPETKLHDACIDLSELQYTGASVSLQIGYALAAAVYYLEAGQRLGISLDAMAKRIFLVSAAERDYFHEVAKLRALRTVFVKLFTAYGLAQRDPYALFILGTSHLPTHSYLDQHMHLIRHSIQAMASVLGGVSGLMLLPHTRDPQDEEAQHLALHVSHLLRYECQLGKVQDPAAGAYFFEALTDMLARKGWEHLQVLSKKGGLQNPQAQAWLHARMKAQEAQHHTQIRTRQQIMLGVNAYSRPQTPQAPKTKTADLYSEKEAIHARPYEKLRERAVAYFTPQRKHPQLWLASQEEEHTQVLALLRDLWHCIGFLIKEGLPLRKNTQALVCVPASLLEQAIAKAPQALWVYGDAEGAEGTETLAPALRHKKNVYLLDLTCKDFVRLAEHTQNQAFDALSRL